MGKTRRVTSSVGISHNMLEFQDGRLDFDLENRQERLQKVLKQRRQAARTEASTATPTTTPATSEAVPDNKEPRKSKGLEAVVFDMLGQCLVQSRGHFESFLRCVCYFTTMFFNKIYSLSY